MLGWEPAAGLVLNVACVRTLLSAQQTGRIENIKISLKLLHIQLHVIFMA